MVQALPINPGVQYREWRPCWASGVNDQYTLAEATQFGDEFEIGVFHGALTNQQLGSSGRIDNMHTGAAAAGHDCIVCVYVNGTYAEHGDDGDSGVHRKEEFMLSDSPYGQDAGKAEPYYTDGTWLMDVRLPGWLDTCLGTGSSVPDQYHARRQGSQYAGTNADGAMTDSLGSGVISPTYNDRSNASGSSVTLDKAPINPQTGITWNTGSQKGIWTRATAALLAAIAGKHGTEGGATCANYCNGASRGTRWFDIDGPAWILARHSHLIGAESWIRDAGEALDFTSLQTLNDWTADVNMLIDCQNLGRGMMLWTKVWANHTHTDDTAVTATNDGAGKILFTQGSATGLSVGEKVYFGGSGTTPTNISDNTVYFVHSTPASTTFRVSTTSGGSAVAFGASDGQNVKWRRVISQNATDDNDDVQVVKWHRLFAVSFMLGTDGRCFASFVHDWPNGSQRIPPDRWRDKINAMGWPTETFNSGLGVWATNSGDTFTAVGHGFSNGNQVVVDADVMPGAIPARTALFIRQKANDTFKLATTNSDATIITTTSAGTSIRVRSKDGATGGITAAKDPTSTNLYVRHYTHGIVICNPTGAATLNTYTLPAGTWYDVDDTPLSGTITVNNTKYGVMLRDAL